MGNLRPQSRRLPFLLAQLILDLPFCPACFAANRLQGIFLGYVWLQMSSRRMTVLFSLSRDGTPQVFGIDNFRLTCILLGQSEYRSHKGPLQKRKLHMLYDIPGKAGTN